MTELDRLMEGEGVTPLMRAIHAKRPEEVEALIAGEADPNARSKQGLTPLFLAVLDENVALTETLLARGANARLGALGGVPPLATAARLGSAACVEVLLRHGAEPEASLGDGTTALMTAAHRGNADVATLLLDAGADPRRRDKEGRTALNVAVWGGHVAIIDVLLARGAVVDESDPQGFTALRVAVTRGRSSTVERLLRAGANPNEVAQGTGGTTALIYAACQGYPNVARLLLEAGADPNARDESGRTALIYASTEGHRPCTQVLLAHGADPALEATDGKLPIRYIPLPPITRRPTTTKRERAPIMMRVRWAFTRGRRLHGLEVGVWGHDAQQTTAAFQKVSDALELLARYDRRVLERMRREMPRILVAPVTEGLAVFKPSLKMCVLAGDPVHGTETPAAVIASYFVHVATYVRLTQLGFGYGERERRRIERLCAKATLALADRIPGASRPPSNLAGRLAGTIAPEGWRPGLGSFG